jgi:3-hydroxyacyl-CoA dehydrogenase, C-terminal domain
MKVYVVGDAVARLEIEARLAQHNHQSSSPSEADVILDLCVNLEDKQLFLVYGNEPDDERVQAFGPDVQPLNDAAVYSLCYAANANSLAALAQMPSKLIGFSVIPPVTNSSIIEITRPLTTPRSELEAAKGFFESLGFEVIEVPDSAGLIAARVIACLANEAFSALAQGVADARTIDTAMKLGLNYPHGPLEWAEMIGLKDILAILEGLHAELGEQYRPHALLRRLVTAGMGIETFEKHRP